MPNLFKKNSAVRIFISNINLVQWGSTHTGKTYVTAIYYKYTQIGSPNLTLYYVDSPLYIDTGSSPRFVFQVFQLHGFVILNLSLSLSLSLSLC